MTSEQMDRFGRLIDKCDNLTAATALPVRAETRVEGLRVGVIEIRAALLVLYEECGGDAEDFE